jgi:uroporphyrinogen-III synthase
VRPGERLVLPQSDAAAADLALALGAAGAKVVRVVSYRTRPGTRDDAEGLVGRLRERVPDIVLFASPSAVRGLGAVLTTEEWTQLMNAAAIVSIGPTTSAQVAALGLHVACEARPHTNDGLLAALVAWRKGRRT